MRILAMFECWIWKWRENTSSISFSNNLSSLLHNGDAFENLTTCKSLEVTFFWYLLLPISKPLALILDRIFGEEIGQILDQKQLLGMAFAEKTNRNTTSHFLWRHCTLVHFTSGHCMVSGWWRQSSHTTQCILPHMNNALTIRQHQTARLVTLIEYSRKQAPHLLSEQDHRYHGHSCKKMCLVETEASGSWNVKLPPLAPGGKDIERFLGLLHHDGHLAKRQMFRSLNDRSEKVSDVDWSWFAYQICSHLLDCFLWCFFFKVDGVSWWFDARLRTSWCPWLIVSVWMLMSLVCTRTITCTSNFPLLSRINVFFCSYFACSQGMFHYWVATKREVLHSTSKDIVYFETANISWK